MQPSVLRRTRPFLLLFAAALAACGGSADTAQVAAAAKDAGASSLIRANVSAATGGTFRDASGAVTVKIPAGALTRDANLRVSLEKKAAAAGPNQTIASPAYEIKLDSDGVSLAAPMTIEVRATIPAVHPQLGELAMVVNDAWQRRPSSF
jgi:hypothetical protein